MPEREGELCPFSGHAVLVDDITIPIECPLCGSIRKTQSKDRHIMYWTAETYPNHPQRLQPSSSKRKRWKKVGEKWLLIEGRYPPSLERERRDKERLRERMSENTQERVTVDDLDRIFIRAETPEGRWVSIDVKSCSDKQFDTWARSRMEIQGAEMPWSLEERADFCQTLWEYGALHMLKKNVSLDEQNE